jgi:hypothetical protein
MENRVQLARFIGQMAVQMGQRELAKRIEEQRAAKTDQMAESEQAPDHTPADTPAGKVGHDLVAAERVERVEPVEPVAPVEPVEPVEPLAADMLPISDYESLAAIHVVERLRSMSSDEIELIRRFEVAHRSRRTILAKIDQLQGR